MRVNGDAQNGPRTRQPVMKATRQKKQALGEGLLNKLSGSYLNGKVLLNEPPAPTTLLGPNENICPPFRLLSAVALPVR